MRRYIWRIEALERIAQQCCWVHLLRDLRQLNLDHATPATPNPELPVLPVLPAEQCAALLTWTQAVIQTCRDGKTLTECDPPPAPAERKMLRDELVQRMEQLGLLGLLGLRWAKDKGHPAQVLCKHWLRHADELFEFVVQPGLAPDNNLDERSLRPLVIARKVSGGTHSERGSNTRMDLRNVPVGRTVFATRAAQGKSALDECRAMLARPLCAVPLPQV